VNIIAHSKGGLDARYAISCLGMDEYVASLTTINTPHRGCSYADFLLSRLPRSFVRFVSKRYDNALKKLGEKSPDFYGAVSDLTAKNCAAINEAAGDCPGVVYQSITSKLKTSKGAMFPLNISYLLAKKFEGDNDGLVSVESAKWGKFMGVLEPKKKRGISHGDVIDLNRENIKGFDVCELYVNILKDLKENNL
jgi:triacylglycerol lipase